MLEPCRSMLDSRLVLAEPVLRGAGPRKGRCAEIGLTLRLVVIGLSFVGMLTGLLCLHGGHLQHPVVTRPSLSMGDRQFPLFRHLFTSPKASQGQWWHGRKHILCTGGA